MSIMAHAPFRLILLFTIGGINSTRPNIACRHRDPLHFV